MALFIRQNEDRSKLQEKLAAELQEKAKVKALQESQSNDIEDSAYLEGTKRTTSLAWVWILIVVLFVGVLMFLMMQPR
jgi:hypothetical protein